MDTVGCRRVTNCIGCLLIQSISSSHIQVLFRPRSGIDNGAPVALPPVVDNSYCRPIYNRTYHVLCPHVSGVYLRHICLQPSSWPATCGPPPLSERRIRVYSTWSTWDVNSLW